MRKDLGMRKGKMIAQGAHASLAAILNAFSEEVSTYPEGYFQNTGPFQRIEYTFTDLKGGVIPWLTGNFKKVCVYVNSEEELLALYEKAKASGIITSLITDSGLTEFNGVPTNTCIAVGPDFEDKINEVTGGLPLL
jgi:PTH2 family peptidyl-tRNA hydrolase